MSGACLNVCVCVYVKAAECGVDLQPGFRKHTIPLKLLCWIICSFGTFMVYVRQGNSQD